ncbi:hypothetical protein ACET3X_003452 [Alternaria dauci]|uniref:MARVEL domain-containing protein n=1 Tax=Alternaria dauci TaxID=48095 RepID=A0ABR3UTL0_9PLEO
MSSSSTSQTQAARHAPDATSAAPPSPVPLPPPKSVARLSDATNANATSTVNANSPRIQASSSPASGVPTTDPTTSIPNTTAPPQAATTETETETEEPLSFNDKLNAGDRYWKFKFGLGAVAIITGLVGIGCFAYLMTTDISTNNDYYYYMGYNSFAVWPALITWSISVTFVALCMIVFLVRKRPVHPGVRVSMDLLLWLAFIVTAMFALFALRDVLDYGLYGGPDGYSYGSGGGDYVLASNGTWVWEQDTSYVNSARDCDYYGFQNCEEQDAYVNKLWAEKGQRSNTTLTGVVCQFFGLVIHFALFVWACVDCHRYNRSKVSKDAEKIAANIVQTMITSGAIVPPPGQAHTKPQPGQVMYYQMPPNQQGYPMQPPYMQQGPGQTQQFGQYPQMMPQQQGMAPVQYPMGQPGMPTVAPINEKSAGPRYA